MLAVSEARVISLYKRGRLGSGFSARYIVEDCLLIVTGQAGVDRMQIAASYRSISFRNTLITADRIAKEYELAAKELHIRLLLGLEYISDYSVPRTHFESLSECRRVTLFL
ncbi:hypothetical protein Acr_15g0002230 [Actinidia rufa]|uniref:Uncharacterized protein n=1 Tax=Actinidia rufa TaxID=165716 RepID=A0A7J0FSS6_9ERIC|nr:hypothetical protein Acr_15g0002230 [Actinidia rufa]